MPGIDDEDERLEDAGCAFGEDPPRRRRDTPLAPVPPAYGVPVSGKNMDRSTTMSAGVTGVLDDRRDLRGRGAVEGRELAADVDGQPSRGPGSVKTFSSALPGGVIDGIRRRQRA